MSLRELKIGASGVRGVVGDALTPELVVSFACAFGTWCGGGPVVIGRDTRRSSTAFRAAVVSGLLSTGCRVIDLGAVPSPLVSFGIREIGATGGIAVTGSHNDARWNALKFFGPDGALLNAARNEELLDVYHGAAFARAPWDRLLPIEAADVGDRYAEYVSSLLDVDAIRARAFRVAVDFANGTCGAVATRVLESLRCTVIPLNAEPTGAFAHAPAPTSANMREVAALTRSAGAALGVALNVDGDRIGFVTADGTALSEEYSLPLVAVPRLRRRPGPIVTNYSTSGMTEALARNHGQHVVRGPVGEGQIVDLGLAEGAVLAGEGSGGVAVLPASVAYDGLLALAFVLDELATSGRTLAELAGSFPAVSICKRELRCPPSLVYKVIDRFRRHHARESPDCADGVRLSWGDSWLHVRASATEPLLRIIAEAPTGEGAEQLVGGVVAFAQSVIAGREGRPSA
jgi:phosphomannomutase